MLIAKVYVAIEIRHICAAQYQYSSHICHFLRGAVKVYTYAAYTLAFEACQRLHIHDVNDYFGVDMEA